MYGGGATADHAFWLFVIAPPMMMLGVITMSVIRGEVKHTWSYEEHWDLQPSVEEAVGTSRKQEGCMMSARTRARPVDLNQYLRVSEFKAYLVLGPGAFVLSIYFVCVCACLLV